MSRINKYIQQVLQSTDHHTEQRVWLPLQTSLSKSCTEEEACIKGAYMAHKQGCARLLTLVRPPPSVPPKSWGIVMSSSGAGRYGGLEIRTWLEYCWAPLKKQELCTCRIILLGVNLTTLMPSLSLPSNFTGLHIHVNEDCGTAYHSVPLNGVSS